MVELARLDVNEVEKMIDSGEPVLLIDTRSPKAWSESEVKLPGALRIHFSEIEEHLDELPHDTLIITYCT